jgi:hydroxymethylbilane synthase
LHEELSVICLTKGVDSSDSLVLRAGETVESLPKGALIATSSARREQNVKVLRSDLTFCDLRGTIEKRLAKLDSKEADGIVVAEAALIRLGLTHLNRVRLPGETALGQGQLAIVALKKDKEIKNFFKCLDCSNL